MPKGIDALPQDSDTTQKNEEERSAKKKPVQKRAPLRQQPTKPTKHKSYVYVRVRPFLSTLIKKIDDKEDGDISDLMIPLKDLNLNTNISDTTDPKKKNVVAAMGGSLPISGFNGVFGIDAKNKFIFQTSFMPKLDTIMKGGTSSFFCYGYTSAGKSYTTLGPETTHPRYGLETGVFNLAAEELFRRVTEINERQSREGTTALDEDSEERGRQNEPYIVTASVVEIYNDDVYDLLECKAKCTLRKNRRGQLLVRGATEKIMLSEEEAEKNGFDFSVITKTLTSMTIQSVEDLANIQSIVHKFRKVGESSEHAESSRSHAIFRLEIGNQTLLNAMQELEEAEQIKPAIQTAYDKKRTYQLRHRVIEIEKKIDEISHFIDDLHRREAAKSTPLGGRLILADLAGADSDHRSIGENGHTKEQRKESTAINKSLLALKECVIALSSSKPIRAVPFRNSCLTRLLEEVLTPREKRDSNSVMIVNVGPESNLKSKTVNSLRYGAMFSPTKFSGGGVGTSSNTRQTTNTSARTNRSRSRTRQSLQEVKIMRMKREMEKGKHHE